MNLNINPNLTTTIAADRRRAFALEADISRTRRIGRLARRAARSALQADVVTARPLVLTDSITGRIARPVPRPVDGAALLTSSDLEHASARVA